MSTPRASSSALAKAIASCRYSSAFPLAILASSSSDSCFRLPRISSIDTTTTQPHSGQPNAWLGSGARGCRQRDAPLVVLGAVLRGVRSIAVEVEAVSIDVFNGELTQTPRLFLEGFDDLRARGS